MEGIFRQDQVRIAAVNWELRPLREEEQFFSHLEELVAQASSESVELLLLPELFQIELLALYQVNPKANLIDLLTPYSERLEQELLRLAVQSKMVIVGGSHLTQFSDGVRNVAPICLPDRRIFRQQKNQLTQWEQAPWGLLPGSGLQKLPDPRLGVLVCYDSEFPEAVRAQAESGVELLCVPSYTESRQGFQRVHFSCLARAVENEIFVAQSCIVGKLGCFDLSGGYGQSCVIAPSKAPFAESAILAQAPLNKEGLAVADINFAELAQCRATGDARPWSDRARVRWQVAS